MRIMTKIAIIGTHGVGKSSLSYMIASYYKKKDKSVKIIQEVARNCPFPLNEKMTKEACLWIFHEQMRKEIEYQSKYDYLICDRSVADSFIYALAQNCYDSADQVLYYAFMQAEMWMSTYDKIIHIVPSKRKISDDGFRSTDREFQKRVHTQFYDWTKRKKDIFNIIEVSMIGQSIKRHFQDDRSYNE